LNDAVAGLFDAARAEIAEQPHLARDLGDDLLLGLALIYAGIIELGAGDGERALKYTEEALELYRRKGDRVGVALAWSNIAPCFLLLQRLDDVRNAGRHALLYARDTYNSRLIVIGMEYLAAAAAIPGPARAARLLGYANAWYARSTTPRDLSEQQAQRWTMERLRNALSADAVTRELEVGAKLTDSDAMEEALAECATVTEAAAAGQVRDAAQSMRSSGD
jgi:tetratricopeptide (TPR) repeat protein